MSDQAIAEGRAAWERLKGNAKTTSSDWLLIGDCLRILRAQTMAEAKSNSPFGSQVAITINRLLHRTAFRTSTATSEGLRDVGLVLLILGHKNGALQFSALIFKT